MDIAITSPLGLNGMMWYFRKQTNPPHHRIQVQYYKACIFVETRKNAVLYTLLFDYSYFFGGKVVELVDYFVYFVF